MLCKKQKTWEDPFYLQLHITDKCNLKCRHCYEETNRDSAENLLRSAEILNILEQFRNFINILHMKGKVYFTGGEPILNPMLYRYISKASSLNLCTMVLSNGTLIDQFRASELSKAGTRIVQISIDGLEETHDFIRGKGSFRKALKGLDCCQNAGINTIVMTTLNRKNMNELEGIIRLCIKHNIPRFSLGRLVPIGNGIELFEQVLTKNELLKIFKKIQHFKKKFRNSIHISIHDPLWLTYKGHKNSYGCSAGIRGICIIENGDIMPCRRLDMSIGNIRNNSFLEIWNSSCLKHFRTRDNYEGKCKNCKFLKKCGGCRAIAKAICGSEYGEDPQCFLRIRFQNKGGR